MHRYCRAFQLRVVTVGGGGTEEEAGGGAPGGGVGSDADEPAGASFEQAVATAQARAKSQAAKEFVRVYNLQKASGMGMAVDPKVRRRRFVENKSLVAR